MSQAERDPSIRPDWEKDLQPPSDEIKVTRRQWLGFVADIAGNFSAGYGSGLLAEQSGVKIDGTQNPDPFLEPKRNYVIEGGVTTATGVLLATKIARHFSPDGNAGSNDRFKFGGWQGFVTGSVLRSIFSWGRKVA